MTGEIIIEGKPFSFERLPWNYNEIPETAYSQNLAKECLFLVKKLLDDRGIPFMLMLGTLLGAYRDGNFIPHDNDLDLGIYEIDDERMKSAIPDMYDAGIKICRFHYGIIYSFIYKGLICDIDVIQDTKFPFKFRYYRVLTELVPKKLLLQYTTYEFLGSSFLIPQRVEDFLVYEYGKDWRVPRKGKSASISPLWMKPFKFVKRVFFFILRKLHLHPEEMTTED